MANAPLVPPDLDEIRRLLRPQISSIPQILADWPRGEGPLADVPLLDPGMLSPRVFEELAGTVRVASATEKMGLQMRARSTGRGSMGRPPRSLTTSTSSSTAVRVVSRSSTP